MLSGEQVLIRGEMRATCSADTIASLAVNTARPRSHPVTFVLTTPCISPGLSSYVQQWQTREHPFPDLCKLSETLHLIDTEYIWIDWFCTPQWSRNGEFTTEESVAEKSASRLALMAVMSCRTTTSQAPKTLKSPT